MAVYYTNPVYSGYLADPFVLHHDAHYYAYGTGPGGDGKQFPVLHSTNLVDWVLKGWALIPVEGATEFWAPEAAYHDGQFYLYYSARGIDGKDHQLHVAVSRDPLDPFADSGRVLVPTEPFTIDAHPFRDTDGTWYLFYSQDFLTLDGDYHAGTGIVVDRMTDMLTLAGEPQVVVRPHADWQLFRKGRTMYGSVYDWHTIEGAAMRVHNGRYYCFYSGGAWEFDNYGLSYVTADHPLGPYSRPEHEGPLLKTVPGKVIGPGHNSFTESPAAQEYTVYHAWDAAMSARLMRIDKLHWDGELPVFEGPTWTEQAL